MGVSLRGVSLLVSRILLPLIPLFVYQLLRSFSGDKAEHGRGVRSQQEPVPLPHVLVVRPLKVEPLKNLCDYHVHILFSKSATLEKKKSVVLTTTSVKPRLGCCPGGAVVEHA